MIAEIQPSFSSHLSMSRKIEYQLSKVKEGNGKVLCTSTGDELAAMPAYMKLISQLNDRVKLPYAEFILSLYPGENLSDERWLSLTEEYIERMGYGKSCYAVVLNTDKAHSHVHVLLTTIDEEGKSIPSGIITAVPKRFQGSWSRNTACYFWKGKEARKPHWGSHNTVAIILTLL